MYVVVESSNLRDLVTQVTEMMKKYGLKPAGGVCYNSVEQAYSQALFC